MMAEGDLENRFTYHKPDDKKAGRHEHARAACYETACVVDALCPDGREKSLAITKLEEVLFWANAAIAREEG